MANDGKKSYEGGPPGGGTGKKKTKKEIQKEYAKTKYIGVPKGYRTPSPHYDPRFATLEKGPKGRKGYVGGSGLSYQARYTEKDIPAPGNRGPDEIGALEQKLIRLGLLDPYKYQPYAWDEFAQAGFEQLLTYANQSGASWEEELDYRLELADLTGYDPTGGGPIQEPLVVQLQNPDDLKGKFNAVSPDAIGRYLTPAEQAAKIGQINAADTAEQTALYEAGGSGLPGGPGGTVTGATSTADGLLEQFKAEHPDEFKATQIGEKGQEIFRALIGGEIAPVARANLGGGF